MYWSVGYAVESENRGIVQQAMDIELKESTIRTWKARYAEELQKRRPWSTISRKRTLIYSMQK